MNVTRMGLLAARPEELGPHMARTCGILEQNLLAFPQGMLGSLLPCVCLFGFVIGSFYFHFVTDVPLESESLDCDSFIFVSEGHESGIDH